MKFGRRCSWALSIWMVIWVNFLLVWSRAMVRTISGRSSGVAYFSEDNAHEPEPFLAATFATICIDYPVQELVQ